MDVVEDPTDMDGADPLNDLTGLVARPVRASSQLQRLMAAGEGLQRLMAASVAPATVTAYRADWAHFREWADMHSIVDPLDASPLEVATYVETLITAGLSLSTVNRRLAAIRWFFDTAGVPSPTADPLVRTTMAGARRLLPSTTRQATPIPLAGMRKTVLAERMLGTGRAGLGYRLERDLLVMALGWAAALRSSELVGLDVDDVEAIGDPRGGDGGVLLRIRRHKTGPAGDPQWVAVPWSTTGVCPAQQLVRWCRRIGSGPLIRSVDRHGRVGRRLGARSVTPIVADLIGRTFQTDPVGITSHSLRAGFVTECRSRDVPDDRIIRHLRHSAGRRVLDRYDRPHDLFLRSPFGEWW